MIRRRQPHREVADVAPRTAEQVGDLFVGELVAIQIDRERGIVVGEAGQDLARERAGLAGRRARAPVRRRSRSRARRCDSCRRGCDSGTRASSRRTDTSRSSCAPRTARVAKHREEHVLDDVARVVVVAKHAPRAAQHGVAVLAIHAVERRRRHGGVTTMRSGIVVGDRRELRRRGAPGTPRGRRRSTRSDRSSALRGAAAWQPARTGAGDSRR